MDKIKIILLLVIFAGVLLVGCAQDAPTLVSTELAGPTPTVVPQPTATLDPEPVYQRGLQHYDEREYDEAIEAFDEVLTMDPARTVVYLDRSLAYYMSGDRENALTDIDRALDTDFMPQTAAEFVKRGRCYSIKGDLELGLADFDSAIEADPQFEEGYVRRANIYTTYGEYEKALNDLEVALEINPSYSLAFTKLGAVYLNQGDYGEALEVLEQAIELNPLSSEAYILRGSVKAEKGEQEAAIADFDKVIELQPANWDAYIARGNANDELGNFELALADYAEAIELNPDNSETYFQRGVAYMNQGEYELALADYDQAITLKPDHPGVYVRRGLTYDYLGETERALADYSHAIEIDPDYAGAYYQRGLSYDFQEEYDLALADFDRVLQLDPEDVFTYMSRGRDYAILGLRENAMADLDRAIAIAPEIGYAHYLRGLLKIDAGDLKTARSELEMAVDLGLNPDLSQYADNILAEMPVEGGSVDGYNGYWRGNTSQGDVISFAVEEGQIVMLEAGYSGPGCEAIAPLQMMNTNFPIQDNQISAEGGGVTVLGEFESGQSAAGSLEVACGDGVSATWFAAMDASAMQTLTEDEFDKMPTYDIPVKLFSPTVGMDFIDENIRILGMAGDWFLVRENWSTDLPIPMGWTGTAYLSGTVFNYDPAGSNEDPAITLVVSWDCETDAGSSENYLSEVESELAAPNVEILEIQTVDDEKGYLKFTTESEGGTPQTGVIVVSRNSSGCFAYQANYVDSKLWPDTYPLIVNIVESWYEQEGDWLGVSLPAER